MARRWFVQETDGYISGFTEEDDLIAPVGYVATIIPDDATGVPPEGVCSGSHWNAATSVYTPRSGVGITSVFDETTPLGRKQQAALNLHNGLVVVREQILIAAPGKVQAHVQRLLEFEAMKHWANYLVMNSPNTWGVDESIAWAEQSLFPPEGVTSVQTLFEQIHNLHETQIPVEACTWVNPYTAVSCTLGEARMFSWGEGGNGSPNVPWFAGLTSDLFDVDQDNGSWIWALTLQT